MENIEHLTYAESTELARTAIRGTLDQLASLDLSAMTETQRGVWDGLVAAAVVGSLCAEPAFRAIMEQRYLATGHTMTYRELLEEVARITRLGLDVALAVTEPEPEVAETPMVIH